MSLLLRCLCALALLASPALAEEPAENKADVPPTTWPAQGREACPSLRACCVPGEEHCVHPGLSRALLGGIAGTSVVGGGAALLFLGDGLNAGDPQAVFGGLGVIGLSGALFGALADALTPGPAGTVHDRPSRPTVRVSLTPGGTRTLDEVSPYGLGLRVDPTLRFGVVSLQPHLGVSFDLGPSSSVEAVAAPTSGQESGFPVVLRDWRFRASVGAELAVRLPYPVGGKPMYTGAAELRWAPRWELRRRTLHPGEANVQVIEHSALYPVNLGIRWHVAPRQRFTFYMGPRLDWISFSEPGSTDLRRGRFALGSFYGEAWWQLDIPFSPRGQRAALVSGRLNLGYIHSNLDGQRLDFGAVVGFFGPIEVSFDLRIRKRDSPVALQLTAGARVAKGGGPFLEVGFVAPDIGKRAGS